MLHLWIVTGHASGNQSQIKIWDPPRGSQRVPEEELKLEFNGKVARTIIGLSQKSGK